MKRLIFLALALVLLAVVPRSRERYGLRVGSKKFTESVILGEMAVQLLSGVGERASHLSELGGTRVVFDALKRGEIDVYPEYTGTLRQEIYADRPAATDEDLRKLLADDGIVMSKSLGFSNNYALAMRAETAKKLGIKTIADLARRPEVRLGLSNEFLDRADGWKNLRERYGLPQEPTGMDHDLAYNYLAAGSIDATDIYTTDARPAELGLAILDDNLHYFPRYDAVLLMRADLSERSPHSARQLARLEGRINEAAMAALNGSVQSRKETESQAASRLLMDKLNFHIGVKVDSVASQVWQRTLEHCDLVRRSLIPAIFVAVPLGVLAAKRRRAGRVILGAAGIVQTIPALALLVLLIAPVAYFKLDTVGTGSATAIVALFLYSLLPIVQNTATGLTSIPPEYRESAEALGLSPAFRLMHIELPLASPSILAGIKTAAVLNVGFATLGALVGARGYGQPILTGIRLNNTSLILQGAVPAACMALMLQLAFEFGERWLLPAGLRDASQRSGAPATA
jgi:osmoprotectant transport system permease protein